MKTAIYYDPVFLEHETGDHPEQVARARVVVEALRQAPFAASLAWPSFSPASRDQVALIHDIGYLSHTEEKILAGADRLDADTAVSFHSWQAAMTGSGALIAAVADVVAGTYANAFCPVRPPGHHAERGRAMGFCLINHVAVAARVAQVEQGLRRIAIVDFDIHHGNGTQNSFYDDPTVLYVSSHLSPHYPGTGAFSETGAGDGVGATINLPLPAGFGDREIVSLYEGRVVPAVRDFAPELILISAGFDGHRDDPLGGLRLTEEGFTAITGLLVDLAAELGHGRIVSTLEGGYDLDALSASVSAHVGRLVTGANLR